MQNDGGSLLLRTAVLCFRLAFSLITAVQFYDNCLTTCVDFHPILLSYANLFCASIIEKSYHL